MATFVILLLLTACTTTPPETWDDAAPARAPHLQLELMCARQPELLLCQH